MASADDQQPTKVSFDEYSWEEDEEWQVLIKKLEFPATFDESKKEKHILKRKQKYFKAKVDPDFKPTIGSKPRAAPSSPPLEPESNPHDPANASSSTSSSAQSAPQHAEPAEPTASSSTSSSSSSSSSYNRGGYGGRGRYQPPPTKIGQMLSPLLNVYYLVSQWFVFVCCLLSLMSSVFYYRALYATVLMYIVNAIQSNGRPQMNMYYASRLMQDPNVMIAIYAAIFLMGNPVFLFLSPLLLRSLWMGVFLLNGLLRAKVPSLHNRVGPLMKPILQRMGWFNERIAMMEVLVGLFLIPAMLFMSRTFILCFVYWQIMHARYMMDYQIQAAFRALHIKITGVLQRVPFALNLYLKMTGYLWTMVDPQRLQEQMQSGGGGAGGLMSGLMSKCTVM